MLALPVSRLAAPVWGTNTKGKYLNLLNKFVDDAWSIQGLDEPAFNYNNERLRERW